MPKAAPVPAVPAATTPSYEDALAELERLMPLDELLAGYKRGAELLEVCRSRLAAVEAQVKVLEDGQLKAWTPGAGS